MIKDGFVWGNEKKEKKRFSHLEKRNLKWLSLWVKCNLNPWDFVWLSGSRLRGLLSLTAQFSVRSLYGWTNDDDDDDDDCGLLPFWSCFWTHIPIVVAVVDDDVLYEGASWRVSVQSTHSLSPVLFSRIVHSMKESFPASLSLSLYRSLFITNKKLDEAACLLIMR